MLPRFYAPNLDARRKRVTLPADEARHLTRVLRLRVGDEVAVFDGRGLEFHAAVETAGRETASLRLLEPLPPAAPPTVRIAVVQALLKGSSMDDAIRDATMMGAEAIQPVLTAHCDVKVSLARRQGATDRWQRVALAAVKQSRRSTLPAVEELRTFDEWIAEERADLRLLFVEPSARCTPRPVKSLFAEPIPPRAAVLLGPEGGWSPEEVEVALRSGCVPVTLGPLTLRADSMSVAALAALAAIWQV
jgi:16S rRNA (uracil1498-N3)-methyltransferase